MDINKMAIQFADAIVEDFIRQNVVPAPPEASKKK